MVEIKSKKINYGVEYTDDSVKATANFSITQENLVQDLNWSAYNTDGNILGNIYYSEHSNGHVNKSINGVEKDNLVQVEDTFNAFLAEVKTTVI